tara:strand:- start:793 stop:1056 length:264 start_codon:yes stop_codon:yes gene_type:complete
LGLQRNPDFLSVKPGDYIVIKGEGSMISSLSEKSQNYWFGKVIRCIGGARNPKAWTLFQVMNIDSGEVTIINADIVDKILQTSKYIN